jgi:hypothetical protein
LTAFLGVYSGSTVHLGQFHEACLYNELLFIIYPHLPLMVVFDLTACTVPCTLSMRMTKSTPTCIGLCVCITSKERRRSGELEKTKVQGAGAALSHMTTQQFETLEIRELLRLSRRLAGFT